MISHRTNAINQISECSYFLYEKETSSCSWYVRPFFYWKTTATESDKAQNNYLRKFFFATVTYEKQTNLYTFWSNVKLYFLQKKTIVIPL